MSRAIAEWEKYLADKKPSSLSPDLIEAFFHGYRTGMQYGMEEGRKLCLQLTAASNAHAAEPSASSDGEPASAE